MTKRTALLVLLAAAPLAACAGDRKPQTAAAPAACFQTTDITGFQPVDAETARFTAKGALYELKVTGVCPDLNWSDRVVLTSEGDPATSATLCTGSPVRIMTPSPHGGFQECFGNEIRAMSRPAGS